jgi:iron complex outermembrane receptor protein
LDLQGVQSIGEALRYTAGVNPEQYGGVDQRIDWYMVRGFQTSFVYIDGLTSNSRYTLMAPKVDPYGADSIEVLLGPTSVLYGPAGSSTSSANGRRKRPAARLI